MSMFSRRNVYRRILSLSLGITAVYTCLWFIMDIPQIHHDRARAFMWGTGFSREFMTYIGGPSAYLHALLHQAFASRQTGVAVLTGIFFALYGSSYCLSARYSSRPSMLSALVPAVLGITLVRTRMTLVPVIGLIAATGAACLYVRLPVKKSSFRTLTFLFVSAALYYMVAGGAILFVTICAIHEFSRRRGVLAAIILVAGLLVPLALRHWLYEPNLLSLYFRNAPLEEKTKSISAATVLLYAAAWLSFPIGAAWSRLTYLKNKSTDGKQGNRFMPHAIRQAILLTAGTCLVPLLAPTPNYDWTIAERLTHEKKWDDALECIERLKKSDPIISHMAIRALFHSGRLLDDMFAYPQYADPGILLLDSKAMDSLPRAFDKRSAVYLDLGMISRAERWTLEAITVMGELPWLAKRMFIINMAKGRPGVAGAYLGILNKMPFQENWVRDVKRRLDHDPLLLRDPRVTTLRKSMLKVNYVDALFTEELLGLCLTQNPNNRMAFEYLMAYYIITRQSNKLAEHAKLLPRLGYTHTPRHLQEALLSHARKTRTAPPSTGAYRVTPETVSRFDKFLALSAQYGAGSKEEFNALRKDFGDTYWFFEMFGRSGTTYPPGEHE